ncbi:MAG: hypothetical protein ACR2FG_10715 [Marmoricola sp.]
MSEPASQTRPRQVTMAAWVGGGASLAMLLTVGDLMSKLNTVDLRESVAAFLSTGGGTSLGVDLDQALLLARIGLLVTGATSAATLVLAVFASRRDRSARIAMSVLALPLLVCGVFVDPFLAGFVVAAAVLLWTRPASDWFAGRTPRAQPAAEVPSRQIDRPPRPSDLPPSDLPSAGSDQQPPPAPAPYAPSYGEPTTPGLPPAQGISHQPAANQPVADQPHRAVTARPRQVTTACLVTWAGAGFAALMMVATLFALQSQTLLDELRNRIASDAKLSRVDMTFDELVLTTRVVAVLMLLWALGAVVLAGFAFRRQAWARIALTVSAGAAAILGLMASITFPGFLVVSVAAVAAVILLFHRDSSRWYAGARAERPVQPPPTQPW